MKIAVRNLIDKNKCEEIEIKKKNLRQMEYTIESIQENINLLELEIANRENQLKETSNWETKEVLYLELLKLKDELLKLKDELLKLSEKKEPLNQLQW